MGETLTGVLKKDGEYEDKEAIGRRKNWIH